MNAVINVGAFAFLTTLWLAFGAALLLNQELVTRTWRRFRRLPSLVQIGVALFVLPIVLGLAIWQLSWPTWIRLTLLAGLAWITIYTFFPRLIA